MSNPLTKNFRGYPAWGWIVFAFIMFLIVGMVANINNTPRPKNTPIDFTRPN